MDAFEPLLGWAMVVEREAELEEQQSAARAAEEAEARAKADAEAVHSGQQDMEARVAELERTLKGVNEAVVSHSTKGQRLKEQVRRQTPPPHRRTRPPHHAT
jgi:chromosome condensin MukBEF ATPase and DNA-binding subunit MukB